MPHLSAREDNPDRFEGIEQIRCPVDNETAWLLAQGIRVMHVAENDYAHVIRLLRADPRAAAAVAELWIKATSSDPMFRWSLLYILAEIEDTACRDVLRNQAMRQLPKRIGAKGICEQTSDYEELVAVMAIEGLGRLAQAGDNESVEVLMQVVARQDRRSLRQPAVAALLDVRAELRATIEKLLPESERYLVDLRKATEKDFFLDLAHSDRDKKPRRRETGPKPALAERFKRAPAARRSGEGT